MAPPQPDMAPPQPDMAPPQPDMAPPPCDLDAIETRACGLNARGLETRRCHADDWGPWSPCVDPDACIDGAERANPCGPNGRGEQRSDCVAGRWQEAACVDPDGCTDGAIERGACPVGPERQRVCADGRWGPWSDCAAPPGLLINEILPDPPGVDAASAFIELWGPPGTALAGVSVVAINGNGGQPYAEVALDGEMPADGLFVIADPDAHPALAAAADLLHPIGDLQNGPDALQLWRGDHRLDALAYGDSVGGEGRPAPDPGQAALGRDGAHRDTDDNFADFAVVEPSPGALEPGACPPGAVELDPCGLNGRGERTRVCDGDTWGGWSACVDPDACTDGDIRALACGPNLRGLADTICVSGAWGPPSACEGGGVCVDDDVDPVACGPNGRGVADTTCVAGAWGPPSACAGADACAIGAPQAEACGLNGRGERARVCGDDGAWPDFGPCVDPDVCADGDAVEIECDDGHATRRCVEGAWVDGPCRCGVPDFFDDAVAIDGGWRAQVVTEDAATHGSCGGNGSEAWRRFVAPDSDTWVFTSQGDVVDTVLYARATCADEASERACNDDSEGLDLGSRIILDLEAGDVVYLIVDQYTDVPPAEIALDAVRCRGEDCEADASCFEGDWQPVLCADDVERFHICVDGAWREDVCGCDVQLFFDQAEQVEDGAWSRLAFPAADISGESCSPEGYDTVLEVAALESQIWVFEANAEVTLQGRWFCEDDDADLDCATPAPDTPADLVMPIGADDRRYLLLHHPTRETPFEIVARPCGQLDIDHRCRYGGCAGDIELASRCGLNGRGLGQRRCEDYAWVQLTCDDPDLCLDGDHRTADGPCPAGEVATEVCALGSWVADGCAPTACTPGADVDACGRFDRGLRTRPCVFVDGEGWDFGPWGPCDDPDVCPPGSPGCVHGYREGGYGAQGILRAAGLDRDTLWNAVGLGRVLSLAIADAQQSVPATTWPGWTWPSLAALSAVDGVDAAALDLLMAYARAEGWLGRCGDGHLQPGGEQCEDGNLADGDGCAADCTLETVCGDGVVEGAEQCDTPDAGCDDACRFTALPAAQGVELGPYRRVARRILLEYNNQLSNPVSSGVEIVLPQRTRIAVHTETGPRRGWYGSTACPHIRYTTNNDVGIRDFRADFRPTVRFDPVGADGETIEVPSPDPCNTDIAVDLPPGRYRMAFEAELPGAAIRELGIIDFMAFIDDWIPLGGPTCGDGIVEGAEECDDGDQSAHNCRSNCLWPRVNEWWSFADGPLLPPSDTVYGIGSIDLDDTPRDTDIFHIELDAPADVFIGLTTPEGGCAFDASLMLTHDADQVGSARSAATGPDGCPEIARGNWPAGASTIQVRGVPDVGSVAPYRLTVARQPGD